MKKTKHFRQKYRWEFFFLSILIKIQSHVFSTIGLSTWQKKKTIFYTAEKKLKNN